MPDSARLLINSRFKREIRPAKLCLERPGSILFWQGVQACAATEGSVEASPRADGQCKALGTLLPPRRMYLKMQQEQILNSQKPKSKIWIIIIGIISAFICLCVGAIIAFRLQTDLRQRQYVGQPTPIPDKVYVELRTSALNRKPSELDLDVDPNSNQPYGVIMDWNVGQATSTLVSFATGDASLYYSTGGGWLGGIAIEKVNSASVQFVTTADGFVDKLNTVTTFPMPPVGYVRFYIITPQGVYDSGNVDSDTLIKDGIDFSSLSDAAQYVIFEISRVPQK